VSTRPAHDKTDFAPDQVFEMSMSLIYLCVHVQVKQLLSDLKRSKKIAAATHNILAYR